MTTRFLRDRRGNVALLVGLMALPIIGLIGLAIDFGAATMARARLDLAADAAALLATSVASTAFLNGVADPVAVAQAAAVQRFTAQAGSQAGLTLGSISVVVNQSGTVFEADVSYGAILQTTLGAVLGIRVIPLDGHSSATQATVPYVDVNVLIDVSSSMAIAASPEAILQMQSLTAAYVPTATLPASVVQGQACAFACHWTATGDDYYALAQRNGVQLRIGLVQAALSNVILTLAGTNRSNGMRLGLYTFSQNFNRIYQLSSQIGAASGALGQITPDINDCSANCPDTYLASALTSLAAILPVSGDGISSAASQQFVFIITDGVVDQYSGTSRVIAPVIAGTCAALKAKGITVAVLYTAYTPFPADILYDESVDPVQSQIGPALQACSSASNLFLQADSDTDIDPLLQRLVATALQNSAYLIR